MGKRKGQKKAQAGKGGQRTSWAPVGKENAHLERLYNEVDIVPEGERGEFWEAMRRDLPSSFRFTGSRGHALAVQQRLKDSYIPDITSIKYEDELVEPPRPVPWYPDQLAWSMTTPKRIVRRFPPFASFQKFLVAETDVGNISRQEVVSMIPPLLMGVKPGMTVLDLCAAPGSKSAQLMELIHAGEEDAMRQVAQDVKDGTAKPEPMGPEGLNDDGRTTGLLVSNDSDYKRAHMLIHQMKRLNSPNLIVTNHDATMYPSIRLPAPPGAGANPPKRYLKFDRILADVPCTGDGTARKNYLLWKDWTPASVLNLHAIQTRILVRALQMLKVGGRVVYSTCSMNPTEDEAVIASAIDRCGGSDHVRIVDCSNELPGLKRASGLKSWKVMDREGRIWNSWEQVEEHRQRMGSSGLAKLSETMFPPANDLPLERCVRIFPHMQDTGGFFITVLEKQSEIRPKQENPTKSVLKPSVATLSEELDSKKNGSGQPLEKLDTLDDLVEPNQEARETADKTATVAEASHGSSYATTFDPSSQTLPTKRDADNLDDEHLTKRTKVEDGTNAAVGDRPVHPPPDAQETGHFDTSSITSTPAPPAPQTAPAEPQPPVKRKPGQPSEEPFKYLAPDHEELGPIFDFYQTSERFPRDRLMVRNAQAQPLRTIYYTSPLARDILVANEGQGIKFVHCGVRMFVKQDAQRDHVCRWRIQAEGLRLLEPWLGQARSVTLTHKETLRKLLSEMFPRVNDGGWMELGEIGERVRDIPMGCSILRVEPDEAEGAFSERMVFPLWRSLYSLNLMLPKEERRAMLLRLYNIDTTPANTTQKREAQLADTPPETGSVDAPSAGTGLAEAEEGALKEENEDMGQDQQEQTDSRETWTKDGDEEDRFNTTVYFILYSSALPRAPPPYVEGYVLFANGDWSTVTCNDYQSTYVESGGFARCCTNPSSDCNFVTSCSGVTAFSADTSWACPNDMTCATMTIYESATTDPPALDIFCDAGWEASTIYRKKGISTALGGTLGQGTSTQKTATASPGSLTTAPAASATSTPTGSNGDGSTDSDNDSGGNRSWIAGAVIGPVAGCAVIFGLGYWLARRRLAAPSQGVYQQQPQSPPGTQFAFTTPQYYEKEAPPPPAELPASTAELPGN